MIRVCQCVREARTNDDVISLYLDEFTFYQCPTIANGWEEIGRNQPLARLGHNGDHKSRIVGAMSVSDGTVIFSQGTKIGVSALAEFYRRIRERYQYAKAIYLIMDNWPVHYHANVIRAAQKAWLQIIPLPTYAPWTNPIEKLWRWLRQDILHLHRYANQWDILKEKVACFLRQFHHGSTDLLTYTGLHDGHIPSAPLNWKTSLGNAVHQSPQEALQT